MMYDVIVFENFCFCPSTQNEKPAFSKIFALESVFEKICLRWLFLPNRLAKLEKKFPPSNKNGYVWKGPFKLQQ